MTVLVVVRLGVVQFTNIKPAPRSGVWCPKTWDFFRLIKASMARQRRCIGGRWMERGERGAPTIPPYSVLSTTYAYLMPVEVGI